MRECMHALWGFLGVFCGRGGRTHASVQSFLALGVQHWNPIAYGSPATVPKKDQSFLALGVQHWNLSWALESFLGTGHFCAPGGKVEASVDKLR